MRSSDEAPPRLWLLAPLAYALVWWRLDFLIDDAYIAFRCAERWAAGLGPSFNPGPPVEGFSDPAWVALLALGARLGASLEVLSRAVGFFSGLLLLVGLRRTLVRALGPEHPAATLGVLFLATFPPFVAWSSGGLETGLFTLALFVAFERWRIASSALDPLGLAAGALVATLRIEGPLWVLLVAAAALVARRGAGRGPRRELSRIARPLAVVLAVFAIVFLARWLHFGEGLMNTARVKGEVTAASLARGLRTIASFHLVLLSPLVALALAPRALRGSGAPLAAASLFVFLAFLGWNVAVGGDWMPFFRFLAPASPFLALLLTFGLARLRPSAALLLGCGACALSLLCAQGVHLVPRAVREPLDFRAFVSGYQTELERWADGRENVSHFLAVGEALREVATAKDSIVLGPIGAIGERSGLFIHDRNGLVDLEVARRNAVNPHRSAGHEKRVPRAWFRSRRPTFYAALWVDEPLPEPGSPAFRSAVREWMVRILTLEPREGPLLSCALPELHAVPGTVGDGRRGGLLLLRHTDDAERARAFWSSLGIRERDPRR